MVKIYKKSEGLNSILQMDARYPTRLDAFCNYFRIGFFELELHCVFCRCECSLEDLASFYAKDLALVWKGLQCFATCRRCVQQAALLELQTFCRCTVNATDIEAVTGLPLSCILFRCQFCLKVLSNAEKIACVGRNCQFKLVRYTWRGHCKDCVAVQ